MSAPTHCGSELWITYHQASRTQRQVTAQLIDLGDGTNLLDLEDVLDHVFQQGFVDPKWRSVSWWEEYTSLRLKASQAVEELLGRGIGNSPASALRLVIGTFFFPFLGSAILLRTHCSGHPYRRVGALRIRALRAAPHRDATDPPRCATHEVL